MTVTRDADMAIEMEFGEVLLEKVPVSTRMEWDPGLQERAIARKGEWNSFEDQMRGTMILELRSYMVRTALEYEEVPASGWDWIKSALPWWLLGFTGPVRLRKIEKVGVLAPFMEMPRDERSQVFALMRPEVLRRA